MRKLLLATSALVPLGLASALANPLGGQVVGGSAAIGGTGTSTVTVTQSSQNAVINWQSFNIGAGETTRFIQPNSSATMLNRVTGDPNPSQILGTLTGNGRVFVINPNGVLIGAGAVVNTAGFVASTHDISNADFMAGRYNFNIPGNPTASVVNLGNITATNSGFAALVAPGVRNSGTITATFGKIGLASANGFSLDLYGDKLITIGVSDSIAAAVKDVATGQTLKSLVQNDGKLKANGGTVQLSAVTARTMVDSVINTSGVIEARSIGSRNGKIVLGGPAASTKIAGAPTQTVKVSGTLDVSSRKAKGGTIEVTGESIVLAAATLDASGATGGGKVLIGGDTGGGTLNAAVASLSKAQLEAAPIPTATSVSIDAASSIDASAKGSGDGGKVIVWSDGATTFNGSILARGGAAAGNGGFVEVSGHETLSFNGSVNIGASNGQRGTLLLDPLNARIDTTAGIGVITVASIQAALASGDVIVTTGAVGPQAGDLTVDAAITWGSGNNLGLFAHRNVNVNANITATNGGDVALVADQTGTGTGTVIFNGGAQVSTSGEVNIAYNPTSYTSPTNYSPFVAGGALLTAYMLVNNATDLQNIGTNLAGNYALGRDIDMSGVSGFVPIGSGSGAYTGKFFGFNHTISNLTFTSGASLVGLFSELGSTALVEYLTLKNFNVTSTTAGANVGTLAGQSQGEIRNIYVDNSTVQAASGGYAGGLVGYSTSATAVIADSKVGADVTVSGAGASTGGVVGYNDGDAQIARVWARGAVSSDGGDVGGLVGTNYGTILDSGATGAVDVTGASLVSAGGFAGYNGSVGILSRVFATGDVTGGSGTSLRLGGLVGVNAGAIDQAYARGDVQGGAGASSGGLIGEATFTSSVQSTYATGSVIGAIAGGLIGTRDGTVNESYYDQTVFPGLGAGSGSQTGITGKTTAQLQAALQSGFSSTTWGFTPGVNSNYPHLLVTAPASDFPFNSPTMLKTGPNNNDNASDQVPPNIYTWQQIANYTPPRDNLGPPLILIALGNPPGTSLVGTGGGTSVIHPIPGQPQFTPPPLPLRPVAGDGGERFSSVPPPNENRFIPNEVVVQISSTAPPDVIQSIAREFGLTIIASQTLTTTGRTAYRFSFTSSRSLRDMIRALEARSIVAVAQPNYQFRLMQGAGAGMSKGDPAQYMLNKLSLGPTHNLATGKGVTIAVIDSEADKRHTELQGTISEELDTLGSKEPPHSHGTAMIGAIVSRDRLLGVAPGARILAIRAFGEAAGSADGTTFNILKGLEWATSQGARVINMSFAGPRDPSLERALKTAREKGVVLVAAAGNAGPKSPPLYPGADPNVIAVTATDSRDGVFRGANQGTQLSVAAPGVDVLAPAPDETYQMSTGTSIATAHVSGVVALMLERDPSLTPVDVRKILEATATDLGPKGKDAQYGWGLVNPRKALEAVDARKKTGDATPTTR
ncbi:MAG: S8 family serine peptidase [Xanthobacteraceae bacterium]|nr:S8 family serine peptidase [Xanthobacteraceae bacterium]